MIQFYVCDTWMNLWKDIPSIRLLHVGLATSVAAACQDFTIVTVECGVSKMPYQLMHMTQ